MEKAFKISREKFYRGSNYYLNRMAYVFDLDVANNSPCFEELKEKIAKRFPVINNKSYNNHGELFAETLIQILKLDMNLWISKWNVIPEKDYFIVAVEYMDKFICQDASDLLFEWIDALINDDNDFPFEDKYTKLQAKFDKTLFGGPTLYHILESAVLNDIPVFYIYEENVFQYGYGFMHVRGRSTTFDIDSIKDTEFTSNKDMCKEFLLKMGFPTPIGELCYDYEEVLTAARKLGFPNIAVVVKPLAGHKGQGVTTNITSEDDLKRAFDNIIKAVPEGEPWDGAIVEKMVTGTDHRLLTVGGKFVAALQRIPAYVVGDGKHTIKELIEIDNATPERLDNARSPLCKIKIDQNLLDFLDKQDLTIETIPKAGEEIVLRRVANISAGGVSINVTDKIHPDNIRLAENIGKYLKVTCLGIDFLAEDISKSWKESPCNIIEINAGPGVFMHLAPAKGGSINVPEKIMKYLFKSGRHSRVPLITFNNLSNKVAYNLTEKLFEAMPRWDVSTYNAAGIYNNNEFFCKNEVFDTNIEIMLRNPRLGFACIEAISSDILSCGMLFQGSDIAVLEDPDQIEAILERDVFEDGSIVRINNEEKTIKVIKGGKETQSIIFKDINDKEDKLIDILMTLAKEQKLV